MSFAPSPSIRSLPLKAAGALACLLLGGCGEGGAPARDMRDPPASAEAHCEPRRFEGSGFTLCRFDADAHKLELVLDDEQGPLRNFATLRAHLGSRAEQLRFAMNAGMYDQAGMPIGLYVEDGERRRALNQRDGPGNFHLKPNGVFAIDAEGRPTVTASEDFERRVPNPRWASQSGPMLLIEGELHPRFQEDGESRLVRNGVGECGPRLAWFVIADDPVSFGRFARLFRDELGCSSALYFDGRVSSLWDRPAQGIDAFPFLGPMVAVFER